MRLCDNKAASATKLKLKGSTFLSGIPLVHPVAQLYQLISPVLVLLKLKFSTSINQKVLDDENQKPPGVALDGRKGLYSPFFGVC